YVTDEGSGGANTFSVNAGGGVYVATATRGQAGEVLYLDGDNANAQTGAILEARDATNSRVLEALATGRLVKTSGAYGSLPPVSAASTLALGAAYQNVLGYDVVVTVYLSV